MESFRRPPGVEINGRLDGFDRVRFRGTLRHLANDKGLSIALAALGVKYGAFKEFAQGLTERIKAASLAAVERAGRPVRYLDSPSDNKEEVARQIAQRDGVREGPVCALSCVEPCRAFIIRRGEDGRVGFHACLRKCMHLYHYFIHPRWGWMHARLQTWLPFTVHVVINGREWLSRQMDRASIGYERRENCFAWVEDVAAAQRRLDAQLRTDWSRALRRIAAAVNPALRREFRAFPLEYYWSAEETEWASDLMFPTAAALDAVYPSLLRQGLTTLGCRDALRFLQRRLPAPEGAAWRIGGEASADYRERAEGFRLKHRIDSNSIKMYNKQGSVLRVETTINNARAFTVYRRPEGQPRAPMRWLPLRKGVADLHRRAQVSQRANDRYLRALSAAQTPDPLGRLLQPLCRPTQDDRGRRARALNPLGGEDATLLEAIGRGEFLLQGLRNRDLRPVLFGPTPDDPAEVKRQSAAVSRRLRLLRAHGLITKVSGTHRYHLTQYGRQVVAAVVTARAADINKLQRAA